MKSLIKKILKESIEDKLYNKLSTILKPPYVDFLKKNGLSDDEIVIILKKFFEKDGGTVTIDFDSDICNVKLTKNVEGENIVIKYQEDLGGYTGIDGVYWGLVHTNSIWVDRLLDWVTIRKYVNSTGGKGYIFPYLDDVYESDESGSRSWSKAPQSIKDNKFYRGII